MERKNPRYFSSMSHPSSILVQLYFILLFYFIWFNVHCSQLTVHALAFHIMEGSFKAIIYIFQVKVIIPTNHANFVMPLDMSSHFDYMQALAIWHAQLVFLHHNMITKMVQTNKIISYSNKIHIFCFMRDTFITSILTIIFLWTLRGL
jgi:hypothetical protein